MIFKVFSIIPALYCVKSAGTEGMYELLVFCQVILAILLPSAAIPLFRVASSRFIMGSFKIPWYVEILALLAFLGMLAANVVFSVEMLFGNSSWIMNLRGGMGSSVMVPYAFLLLITWTSLGLTLYLAVTPLKSASVRSDTQTWTCNSLKDEDKLFVGRQDDDQDLIKNEGYQKYSLETALDMQSDKSILELNIETSEAAIECDDDDSFQHSACGVTEPSSCSSPAYQSQKSLSEPEVDFTESMDTVSVGTLSDNGTLQRSEDKVPRVEDNVQRVEDNVQRDELRDLDEKYVGVEVIVPTFKDNKEVDALEREESPGEVLPASISTGPESANNIVDKGFDEGSVSGSLSKLSGLGRAARRQLTAILDEFWGNLFDFHGKLTQEANTKRLDALLGLDSKAIGSSVKSDTIGFEATKSFYPADTERGSVLPAISRDYNSPNQKKFSDVEFSLGVQRGSPSWSQGMQSNRHLQSSSSSLLDPSERAYSSLRLPLHSESLDYQPATIHGYQMASYLKGMGASRNPYSDISQNMSREPKSVGTFLPNIRDQVTYTRGQNELGSSGTSGWPSQDISRINRLQAELPCYDPSLIEMGENAGSSSYTKKYHSSPDISALIAAGRNQYLNEAAWGGPIGPRQSSGRMAYDQSQYLNTVSGVSGLNNVARTGVPLAFDELSPPKIHQNVYSRASSMNMDARSLWSTQPFEQFYGMKGNDKNERVGGVTLGPSIAPKHTIYAESEAKLLKSLRFCIMKLLKLEGSDWLFRQNGGFDEELIDRVAGAERHQHDVDVREKNQELQHLPTDQKFSSIQSSADADVMPFPSLRNCGDNCIWRASLVVSFGVWCIQRTLELALVESRPELWGKYTYVLNRLQGIIEPAFLKPRQHVGPCSCLEILGKDVKNLSPSLQSGALVATEKPSKNFTTGGMVLEVIKDVEAAVSGRKGRTGTAAGDVAFPKGKENLASVLKRYKRRLLNKPPGTHEGTSSSRKIRTPPPTVL
uniref:Ethylene insensitive 2 n=1 Tax=Tulipa gesneriana TaxID=13306 RepID=A0A7S5GBN6_TULGE|nr:ethylene insensitive 2 [Tulipa gesneriana]